MPTLAAPDTERAERLRRFNRFYTRRIGALGETLQGSGFTLAESRLLWELAQHHSVTATELARALALDGGYLSRLLRRLRERGLVERVRAGGDARQHPLALSAAGRHAFAPLDECSKQQAGALLAPLADAQQQQLLQAFAQIEQLLGDDAPPRAARAPWLLRPHRAGDLGWLVSRHGALYAQEQRLDLSFEALVARIAADFIDRFDAPREACWIAERHGVPVGGVLLVQCRDDATQQPLHSVAQLRLLLVEPTARGLGIGERLVEECTRFARSSGYERIRLWTQSQLSAARGIYAKAGYRLLASDAQHSFGQHTVSEIWELAL